MRHLAFALLAACLPGLAAAQGYAGLSVGQSRTAHALVGNIEDSLSNAANVQTNFDATDTAWKAFGGWQLMRYLAIEANYTDLGKHHTDTTMLSTSSSLPAELFIERKVRGYGVDAVGIWPIGPRAAVFARAGAFRARVQADTSLEGDIAFRNEDPRLRSRSATNDKTVAHYGVGGEWLFARNLALRLEWERFDKLGKAFVADEGDLTGEANTDMYSVGLVFRFR